MIVSSQLVRTDGHVRSGPRAAAAAAAEPSAGWRCSTASRRSPSARASSGTAGRSSIPSLLIDERSSSDLQFPIWIYYCALPVGGGLMLIALSDPPGPLSRSVFDPATMTVGHASTTRHLRHGCAAMSRPPARPEWRHSGFLVLFFGLLAAGMPIFLVLGLCAGVLFFRLRPAAGRRRAAHDRPAQLDHPDGAAAVCHGGGVHALGRCRKGAGRSRRPRGSAASAARSGSSPWSPARCSPRSAARSVATALAMGTILLPAMLERGYPRSFALGVVGASGTIGIVIPPSLAADPVRHRRRAVGAAAVPRRHPAGTAAGRALSSSGSCTYARRQQFPGRAAAAARRAAARDAARLAGAGWCRSW